MFGEDVGTLTHGAPSSQCCGVSLSRRLSTTGCTGRCSSVDATSSYISLLTKSYIITQSTYDTAGVKQQMYVFFTVLQPADIKSAEHIQPYTDLPMPPWQWVQQSSRWECRTWTANRSPGSRNLRGPVPLPNLTQTNGNIKLSIRKQLLSSKPYSQYVK